LTLDKGRRATAGLSFCLGVLILTAPAARAQDEVPLVGAARDLAHDVLLFPAAFDPALVLPLTPTPQAAVEAFGGGLVGSAHAAYRNGDDAYGVSVSGPIANVGAAPTPIDPRGLQDHAAFGFDISNVIWRPKATPALRTLLNTDGFAALTPEQRDAARRLIAAGDGVDAPWAVFFNVSYRFSRSAYAFADAPGGPTSTANHLNDAATILLGARFLAHRDDPGYFVGLSYIYSAVFLDAPAVAGTPVGAPTKLRADSVRLDVRRPLGGGRFGVDPAISVDSDTGLKTAEAAAYAFLPSSAALSPNGVRLYATVRVGYKEGGSGEFASIVIGSLFGRR